MERRSTLDKSTRSYRFIYSIYGNNDRLASLPGITFNQTQNVSLTFHFLSTAMEVANPALFQLATTPLVLEQRTELEAVAKRALQGGEANLIVLTPAGHLISELLC